MSDRVQELEARIAELSEALQRVEGRLSALERAPAPRAPARARTAPAAAPDARPDVAAIAGSISLVGRTLLVLAGAFLLRALTDAGTIPASLGIALGLAYAGVWIGLADRASAAGNKASAAFHSIAAVAIGYPLLFEATARFRLLSSSAAAALLTLLTAVAIAVAARRRFEALAWLAALGGGATALALMPFGGRLAPPILYLILLGVATLWLGYVRDWVYLRWPVAIATNLAVVVLATRAVRPAAAEGPGTLLLVELVLLTAYLGSIATRTLLLDRAVVAFEAVQTAALIAVGLGGGSFVAARSGTGAATLGAVSVAIGIAAYAVAFAFAERRRHRVNFYFYGSVAIVFVLGGAALALPPFALPIVLGLLAVAVGLLARRDGRLTLAAHAAAYAIAAAAAGGLLGDAVQATFAPPATWSRPSAGDVAVLALVAAAAWITAGAGVRRTVAERIPRLLLVAVLAVGAEGIALGALLPVLAVAGDAAPGAVATARTAVLVGGVFLLAWIGRSEPWREARWLVHPLLAATGLKLLVEDVSRSRPATLFLAFAAYGAALVFVPRLRRREPVAAPAASPVPATAPEPAATPSPR